MTFLLKVLAGYNRINSLPKKDGTEVIRYYKKPDKENIWVLRVQNSDGYGPYGMNETQQSKWKDKKQKKGASVPMTSDMDSAVNDMANDSEDQGGGQFLYGLKDEKQLAAYFSKAELTKLEELGYAPVWVKAKAAWIGKTQVLFEPYWE